MAAKKTVPRGRAGGRKPRTAAAPDAGVTVRMTSAEREAITLACEARQLSIAQAVRGLPLLIEAAALRQPALLDLLRS